MPHVKLSPRLRAASAVVAGAAAVAFAASCHAGATSYVVVPPAPLPLGATAPVESTAGADSVVNARFRNVHFHVWPGVALDLEDLMGRMHSTRPDHVVSFDDKRSFVLGIDTGVVGLDLGDMGRLMNTYVFAYAGAPLKGLSFATDGNRLVQRGVLHRVVDIPFEMTADVSATPSGEILIHPVSMKICSINGEGLMKALDVTLAKLIDVRQAKGVRVVGNDLLLDPAKVIPPPAISGHLVAVHVEPGRLVQVFSTPSERVARARLTPDTAIANYMLFRGGTLQFGKLFMVHADMQVFDLSPSDPFDFDIGRYHEQLVAGYHRTLPDDGLMVFMPDVAKLTATTQTAAAPRSRG
jgi:hypothetical protein